MFLPQNNEVEIAEGAEFFLEQAKSKLPEAPLLMKADGSAWQTNDQALPMKEAVIKGQIATGNGIL